MPGQVIAAMKMHCLEVEEDDVGRMLEDLGRKRSRHITRLTIVNIQRQKEAQG